MPNIIKGLMLKYRETVSYIFFGALTTLVNYVVYVAWIYAFPGREANVSATVAAWILSVLFAYITNSKWVFCSNAAGFLPKLKECGAFFASRAATGLLDLGIMYLAVDVFFMDGRVMKLASNVIIIILNYVLSKTLIFKR